MASDLGGNCVAISRDSKNRDAAADFLKFLVNEGNMRAFVSAAQFLPVRASLMQQGVTYATRPDAMKVYVQQASTISRASRADGYAAKFQPHQRGDDGRAGPSFHLGPGSDDHRA